MTKKIDYTKVLPVAGGFFGLIFGVGAGLTIFVDNVINYGVLRTAKLPFRQRYVTFSVYPSRLDFILPVVLFTTAGVSAGFVGRKLLQKYLAHKN